MKLLARHFEIYPEGNLAARELGPLLKSLRSVAFSGAIGARNSNQITSDLDDRLEDAFAELGCGQTRLTLADDVSKEYDFTFEHRKKKVVVEVEKANKEKILYDILKCHMYLSAADFALLFLPKNYPHSSGEWRVFKCGVDRYRQCLQYGFGAPGKFDRILLVGYEQAAEDGQRLTPDLRRRLIDKNRRAE